MEDHGSRHPSCLAFGLVIQRAVPSTSAHDASSKCHCTYPTSLTGPNFLELRLSRPDRSFVGNKGIA